MQPPYQTPGQPMPSTPPTYPYPQDAVQPPYQPGTLPVQPQYAYYPTELQPAKPRISVTAWVVIGLALIVLMLGLIVVVVSLTGNTAPAATGTWVEFKQSQGRFSIQMPGQPQEQKQSLNTMVGSIDLYFYQYSTSNNDSAVLYAVGYSDYPESIVKQANTDSMLLGAQNGALSNVNGKLTNSKSITYNGFPGKEFEAEVGSGKLKARIFLVNNRLYQVLTATMKGNLPAGDSNKFLESFKLIK